MDISLIAESAVTAAAPLTAATPPHSNLQNAQHPGAPLAAKVLIHGQ
jgi:hypothetical protein